MRPKPCWTRSPPLADRTSRKRWRRCSATCRARHSANVPRKPCARRSPHGRKPRVRYCAAWPSARFAFWTANKTKTPSWSARCAELSAPTKPAARGRRTNWPPWRWPPATARWTSSVLTTRTTCRCCRTSWVHWPISILGCSRLRGFRTYCCSVAARATTTWACQTLIACMIAWAAGCSRPSRACSTPSTRTALRSANSGG